MAPNKYVQFLNTHRIEDGLLREFLHKEKFIAAQQQIQATMVAYQNKINMLNKLSIAITEDAIAEMLQEEE